MKKENKTPIENENGALLQAPVMVSAGYKGYIIEEDNTGYAPKHLRFSFFIDDGETFIGSGESIEDCKQQIDEL